MGTQLSLAEEIVHFINENIFEGQAPDLQINSQILSSGLLDSFEALRLFQFIEERYGIAIDFSIFESDQIDSPAKIAGVLSRAYERSDDVLPA